MLASAAISVLCWSIVVTVFVLLEAATKKHDSQTAKTELRTFGVLGQLLNLTSNLLEGGVQGLQALVAFHLHFVLGINWTPLRECRALSLYFIVIALYFSVKLAFGHAAAQAETWFKATTIRLKQLVISLLVLLVGAMLSLVPASIIARQSSSPYMFLEHVQVLLGLGGFVGLMHMLRMGVDVVQPRLPDLKRRLNTLSWPQVKPRNRAKPAANSDIARWTLIVSGLACIANSICMVIAEKSSANPTWLNGNPLYFACGGMICLGLAMVAKKRDQKSMT